MPKRTWLVTISGFCLAASLIWTVPVCAQTQKGGLLNSYNQSSGTGSGGGLGHSSLAKKPQSSSGDKFGWKGADKEKNQAPEDQKKHTLAKPHNQPQSQTPGGTNLP